MTKNLEITQKFRIFASETSVIVILLVILQGIIVVIKKYPEKREWCTIIMMIFNNLHTHLSYSAG